MEKKKLGFGINFDGFYLRAWVRAVALIAGWQPAFRRCGIFGVPASR